jgi:antitoxin component YwqK of YwqJK toxin-antitoxin module
MRGLIIMTKRNVIAMLMLFCLVPAAADCAKIRAVFDKKAGALPVIVFYDSVAEVAMQQCDSDDMPAGAVNYAINGSIKVYASSDSIKMRIPYKRGIVSGIVKIYYDNGRLKGKADYKNGKREGIASLYYDNGKLFQQIPFKNDLKDGFLRQYTRHGALSGEYCYKGGVRNGPGIEYYASGTKKMEMNYIDGKREGAVKAYYPNGRIREEASFKAGVLEGLSKEYDETGKVKNLINYIVYQGSSTASDSAGRTAPAAKGEPGEISAVARVDRGYAEADVWKENQGADIGGARGHDDSSKSREGSTKWYHPNGKLYREMLFVNGKLNGLVTEYFETGRLKESIPFTDDNKNGTAKYYSPTGRLEREITYKNGKKNGICRQYNDDGKLAVEEMYSDDVLKSRKSFDRDGKLTIDVTY